MPWIQFYDRMKVLCDTTFTLTFSSFKVTIGRIDKKKTELTRNKIYKELEDLFMQPFCTCVPSPETTELTKKSEMSEIQGALEKEKERNEQLSSKLSLVPVTTDWFDVKYDGEDTILSLKYFGLVLRRLCTIEYMYM